MNVYTHTKLLYRYWGSFVTASFTYDPSKITASIKKRLISAFKRGYIGSRAGLVASVYRVFAQHAKFPIVEVFTRTNWWPVKGLAREVHIRFEKDGLSDEAAKELKELVVADEVAWRMALAEEKHKHPHWVPPYRGGYFEQKHSTEVVLLTYSRRDLRPLLATLKKDKRFAAQRTLAITALETDAPITCRV